MASLPEKPATQSPCAFIGVVEAPDETSALRAAIEEFGIINPIPKAALRAASAGDDDWIADTAMLRWVAVG